MWDAVGVSNRRRNARHEQPMVIVYYLPNRRRQAKSANPSLPRPHLRGERKRGAANMIRHYTTRTTTRQARLDGRQHQRGRPVRREGFPQACIISTGLMVRSAEPVANMMVLVGSNAMLWTHPSRCEESTVDSFQGACHYLGVGMLVLDDNRCASSGYRQSVSAYWCCC